MYVHIMYFTALETLTLMTGGMASLVERASRVYFVRAAALALEASLRIIRATSVFISCSV